MQGSLFVIHKTIRACSDLTADPQKSPRSNSPASGFFFGERGADVAEMPDFGFMPTAMTLVNIGRHSMGQIRGFLGVDI